MKRLSLYSLFFLIGLGLHSQVVAQDYRIENTQANTYSTVKKVANEPTVIFFIPASGLEIEDSLLYAKKAEQLVKRLQSIDVGKLLLRFVYFKQDPKSNANGYLIFSKNKKDSLPIGQLECFFENFDTGFVSRSSRLMKSNFKAIKPFNADNFYRVSITDGNKCFEKLQDRVPYYFDFIKESIRPNYTAEERFDKISDTLILVRNSIVQLKEHSTILESKIDSMRELLQHFFLQPSGPQGKASPPKK